jgi:leucyl-tRNA synthetase
MSLYNHAAVFEDEKMMPRGFFCNGYLLINGKKMSKSEGNFLTIRDCIAKYGVDATRITLADSGDSLDDANFEEPVAN